MNENDSALSPRISVVAPVYKTEKYLRDCVESVLAQSFTDFELILVDDGSPDRCGEICDELAKKDPRIRVLHQDNGGVTSARRLGVEQARGEWINFMDSDDLLPKDALKNLIDEASDDVDWVQGCEQLFNNGETPSVETLTGTVRSFDVVGLAENMLLCHLGPYGKLVRRKLFSPNVFEIPREMRIGEDTLMNLRLIANRPRKAKEIDKIIYLYRQQEGSVTRSYVLTESYVFRYIKLLLSESQKIYEPSNKERLSFALSCRFCGVVTRCLIGYRQPIKFPHRLATLMRRGAKSRSRYFFIYLCLRFNCVGVAYLISKIYSVLSGRNLDAKGKTLLE